MVESRDNTQCMQRYEKVLKPGIRKVGVMCGVEV